MFILSLIFGILIFIIFLIFHILIWRVKKPKNEINFLFLLFIFLPLLFTGIILLINFFKNFTNNNLIFSTFLLYFSLSCAYIQTYPAARANAPSLQIVYFVYKSGEKGLSQEEITNKFNLNNLVYERVEDLIKENFIYQQDNSILLTRKGEILANIFRIYRKLYGLEFGQG
ncbi:MAG TPA: hypothetical protein DDW90_04790 [Cyanobacteria bacterium UBA9971]|nr:hypothetical protein [Cyanobacteria bacterium UBA9971]